MQIDESPRSTIDEHLSGSCLCGGVTYQCRGPLERMARCYCVQCRKASGAECATNADAPEGSFRLTRIDESIPSFERGVPPRPA